MKFYFLAYGLPLLIIALGVPMVAGIVPPNTWYGFRTPKTLSSPEIWYPANRVSGRWMIAAAIAALVFNLVLLNVAADWPASRQALWMANATVILVLLALVPSFLYLRKL